MNVKEVIEELKKYPDDMQIYCDFESCICGLGVWSDNKVFDIRQPYSHTDEKMLCIADA